MKHLKDREIVYANLTLLYKEATNKDNAKHIVLRGVVYKHLDGYYHPTFKNDVLERNKVTEPLKVISVEVIVSLGYANK